MRRLIVLLLVCGASAGLAAQIRVPHLPLDLPLPGIDQVLRAEPPISTTLKDARVEVPFLDRLDVRFGNLASLSNTRGSFTLTPGHWALDLQSFCFRAGTRGPRPTDGKGYLSGPVAGPDRALFVGMLTKYTTLRDVDQHDMQVLIWAILARARIRQMEPRMQALAVRVLTPAQIAALDSGALDAIPADLRQRAFNALPTDVRAVAEAENRLRDILYRANHTYEELESTAVLQGPLPPASRDVPRGRWSVHPGGYLVRYHPTSYDRTTVELAVPPRVTVRRDGKGRIVSVDWGDGRRAETDYDDNVPAFDPGPTVQAVAYAFKRVRLVRPGVNGQPEEIVLRDKGWTFVTKPASRAAIGPQFGFQLASMVQRSLPQRLLDWKERYDHYNSEYRERAEWYRDRYDHMRNPPPSVEQVIHDIEDMEHYRAGIEAAITGDVGDQLGWLIDHQERMNAALERATIEIANLPGGTEDREYAPATEMALPAHAGSQRLGLSGLGFF